MSAFGGQVYHEYIGRYHDLYVSWGIINALRVFHNDNDISQIH